MSWMRGLAGLALMLVAAITVVYCMGRRLPMEHRAVASGVVAASQDVVWALVDDTATQTAWRTGLLKLSVLPGDERCWVELSRTMELTFCLVEEVPKVRRVVRIAGEQKKFGGTWTYTLEPQGAGATLVTITEDGWVKPPLWRFMGHYVMGEQTNVKQFLTDLQVEGSRRR